KQVGQVGVDVDSEELVCAMKRAGQRLPLAMFANTAAGHKKLIRWATKGARPARVCLEATGIYSLEFALALHHAKNVEVMVITHEADTWARGTTPADSVRCSSCTLCSAGLYRRLRKRRGRYLLHSIHDAVARFVVVEHQFSIDDRVARIAVGPHADECRRIGMACMNAIRK